MRILIIDDEPTVRFGLHSYLEAKGHQVEEASSGEEARCQARAFQPDVVLADYQLRDTTALELLPALLEVDPGLPVILMTAHGSIDLAVRALKAGAENFVTKPVALPALLALLERALEHRRSTRRQEAAGRLRARQAVNPFLGESPAITRLAEHAQKVAGADSALLIRGETGAGKGVLARWLHEHGPRAEEAFVDFNCAGIVPQFLESELFGHERGAFTGAASAKRGLLEVAHQGTVFLDEIGDMDAAVQPKLLKVLEDKRFRRLGDVHDRAVDLRLIAATHQDLAALMRQKRFREDLYFRVATLTLTVPSLRERPEDIPLLCDGLLARLGQDLGRGQLSLAGDAVDALARYPWPGNVRELRNVLERAVLLGGGPVLRRKDLLFDAPDAPAAPASGGDLTLKQLERLHVERVLREENGHVEQASRRLGIPRSSLYQKLKAFGLSPSDF